MRTISNCIRELHRKREVISRHHKGETLVRRFTPADFPESAVPRYDASKGPFNRFELQQEFLLPRLLLHELSHPAKDELDPRAVVCSRGGWGTKGGQMFAFFWGSSLPNVSAASEATLVRSRARRKVDGNFISIIVALAPRSLHTRTRERVRRRENRGCRK